MFGRCFETFLSREIERERGREREGGGMTDDKHAEQIYGKVR